MTKQLSTFLHIVYIFLAIVVISLFFTLATRCFFSDSEIWLLTLSQNVFQVNELTSIYYKWLFHFFTYIFSHFAPDEFAVYVWARYGWASISIISAFIICLTMAKAFQIKKFIFPTLIIIVTSSLFYNQGFRIRADMLTLFFHSITIYYLTINRPKVIGRIDVILLSFLTICLLSTTPKAIYFWACQLALGLSLNFIKEQKYNPTYLKLLFISHLFPIVAGAFIIILNAILPFFELNLAYIIATAINFFLKTYDTKLANPDYFSLTSFYYVINFVWQNILHALIIYFFLLITTISVLTKPRLFFREFTTIKAFQLYSIALLLSALLHNHKLPFFLAVCLTPILAYSFFFLYHYLQKFPAYIHGTIPLICCLYAVQISSSHMSLNLRGNNNFEQKTAIHRLGEFVEDSPQVRIYDVIGILPRKTEIFAFTGPSEVSRKFSTMEKIIAQKPNMIIMTHKTNFLRPQIQNYAKANMIQIEPDVWTVGEEHTPLNKPKSFSELKEIEGQNFWIFSSNQYEYIYDLASSRIINEEVLFLNENYQRIKSSKTKPTYFAIPKKYLRIGFAHFAKPNFPQSPYYLFRFDTGF